MAKRPFKVRFVYRNKSQVTESYTTLERAKTAISERSDYADGTLIGPASKKKAPKRDSSGRFVGKKGSKGGNKRRLGESTGRARKRSIKPPRRKGTIPKRPRLPFDPDSLLDKMIGRLNAADYDVQSGDVRTIDRHYAGQTDIWHVFEIDFVNAQELFALIDVFDICRPVLSRRYRREAMLACRIVKLDNEGAPVETGGRPYLTYTQRFDHAFSQLPSAVERFEATGGKFGDYAAFVGIGIEVRAPTRFPRN